MVEPKYNLAITLASLASRCCILMVMVIAAEGVFMQENPGNSLIALHDAFIWLEEVLQSFGIQVPERYSALVWLMTVPFLVYIYIGYLCCVKVDCLCLPHCHI